MIKYSNMKFTILTIFKCKVWWPWIYCQIKGRIDRERKVEDKDRERMSASSLKRLTCARLALENRALVAEPRLKHTGSGCRYRHT